MNKNQKGKGSEITLAKLQNSMKLLQFRLKEAIENKEKSEYMSHKMKAKNSQFHGDAMNLIEEMDYILNSLVDAFKSHEIESKASLGTFKTRLLESENDLEEARQKIAELEETIKDYEAKLEENNNNCRASLQTAHSNYVNVLEVYFQNISEAILESLENSKLESDLLHTDFKNKMKELDFECVFQQI